MNITETGTRKRTYGATASARVKAARDWPAAVKISGTAVDLPVRDGAEAVPEDLAQANVGSQKRRGDRWPRWRQVVTPALDVAIVAGAAVSAGAAGLAAPWECIACGILMVVALGVAGGFTPIRALSARCEFSRLGAALLGVLAAVFLAGVFIPDVHGEEALAGVILAAFAAIALLRALTRGVLSWQRASGHCLDRAVVVGSAPAVDHVVGVLRSHPGRGVRPVAAVLRTGGAFFRHAASQPADAASGDASLELAAQPAAYVTTGGIERVLALVRTHSADAVVVAGALPGGARELNELTWRLARETRRVRVEVAPMVDGVRPSRIAVTATRDIPAVVLTKPASPTGPRAALKRALDLALTLPALLVAAPVMGVIALAVRKDSVGPALFRQERVGRDGERFVMYKFRTMAVDAEARLKALRERDEGAGVLFKMEHDPRVTRVGRFLRKTSLDELPQLLNIVAGHMSLVGPRPALPAEVQAYDHHTRKRLRTKPGLTGPWQVSGRSSLSWEESIRLDLGYVENWTLTGDIVLLARTVHAVLARKGAY